MICDCSTIEPGGQLQLPCPGCGSHSTPPEAGSVRLQWSAPDDELQLTVELAAHPEFGKRYELVELLGTGSQGAVFLARDRRTGSRVALKFLAKAAGPDTRARLEREARCLASVVHPSVVRLMDHGALGDVPYLVLEYHGGGTLRDRLRTSGRLEHVEAARIALGVLAGLEACHRAGVVHRDIKPANILFDDGGRPRISDVGIARAYGEQVSITRTGAVVRTPLYMSPEQIRGEPARSGADIYAFGLVLYEMLTGRQPFEFTSLADLLSKHANAIPEDVRAHVAGIPAPLAAVVASCLAKRISDRPATAVDVARRLERVRALPGASVKRPRPAATPHLGPASPVAPSHVGRTWLCSGLALSGTLLFGRAIGATGSGEIEAAAAILAVSPWTRARWGRLREGDGSWRRLGLLARSLLTDLACAGSIAAGLAWMTAGVSALVDPRRLWILISLVPLLQTVCALIALDSRSGAPRGAWKFGAYALLWVFTPVALLLPAWAELPEVLVFGAAPLALLASVGVLAILPGRNGWRTWMIAGIAVLALELPALHGVIALDRVVSRHLPRARRSSNVIAVPAAGVAVRNAYHYSLPG